MDKEEKEAIEYLSMYAGDEENRVYEGECTYNIEILLNYIHKQEKIIDSLAQWVSNLSPMVDKQAVKDIVYKENKDE